MIETRTQQKQKIIGLLVSLVILVAAPVAFAGTVTYTYDNKGQVTRAEYDSGPEIDYTYDEIGNRVTMTEKEEGGDSSLLFEVGQITLSGPIVSGVTASVNFEHTYSNPVVAAYIMTRNGGESVDVRVKDVTSGGCTIFMEEPDNQEHNPETVGYIVMEAGVHTLEDGTKAEAGIRSISSVHREWDAFGGDTVSFAQSFSSPPVVLHTLNTYNNGTFMTSVSPRVTATAFDLQQEATGSGSLSVPEMIGWIAIESGKTGTINGRQYETGSSQDGATDGVDDTEHTITYTSGFSEAPIIIVEGYSGNGADGYWSRSSGTHTATAHGTFAEEDQVFDIERNHADEGFGFWAIERKGNPFFEVGQITLSGPIVSGVTASVNFEHTYSNPVVAAYIMTRNGGESVDVRVKDVTSGGCTIFMEEPDNQEHNPETVGYIVMEAGVHTLEDGTKVEAGIRSISSVHREWDAFGGDTVSFAQSFSSPPVVLHTLNTYNNGAFMTSVSPRVTATAFDLQQEATGSGSLSVPEMIGWIAIESGKTGTINGRQYETGSSQDGATDGVDDTEHTITYTSGFSEAPIIIVEGYSGNGADGYWSRSSGTHTATAHGTFAEEDQVFDIERSHADEGFGFWAIENAR